MGGGTEEVEEVENEKKRRRCKEKVRDNGDREQKEDQIKEP